MPKKLTMDDFDNKMNDIIRRHERSAYGGSLGQPAGGGPRPTVLQALRMRRGQFKLPFQSAIGGRPQIPFFTTPGAEETTETESLQPKPFLPFRKVK